MFFPSFFISYLNLVQHILILFILCPNSSAPTAIFSNDCVGCRGVGTWGSLLEKFSFVISVWFSFSFQIFYCFPNINSQQIFWLMSVIPASGGKSSRSLWVWGCQSTIKRKRRNNAVARKPKHLELLLPGFLQTNDCREQRAWLGFSCIALIYAGGELCRTNVNCPIFVRTVFTSAPSLLWITEPPWVTFSFIFFGLADGVTGSWWGQWDMGPSWCKSPWESHWIVSLTLSFSSLLQYGIYFTI